jgi:spermidine/putrescine transport system ATP-binding protein
MSALDAHLRAQVQEEMRRLQRELGQTFILVTHDQDEAMVVSDRLAVMREGLVEQVGEPREVYSQPRNQFVAEFLGAANIIPARRDAARRDGGRVVTNLGAFDLSRAPNWDEGRLAIRPERIVLGQGEADGNWVRAMEVREAIYRGQSLDVWLTPGGRAEAGAPRVRVRTHSRDSLRPGDTVNLFFPPEDLVALD